MVGLFPRESIVIVASDKTTVQKSFSAVHCDANLYPISKSTEKKLILVHMQVPRSPTPQKSWVKHCYFHQDLRIDTLEDTVGRLILQHQLPAYLMSMLSHESAIPYNEERNPFLRLEVSEGELLHTPERISTSMTTDLLFRITNTISLHDPERRSGLRGQKDYSSSPDLLTKRGPLKETNYIIFQSQR